MKKWTSVLFVLGLVTALNASPVVWGDGPTPTPSPPRSPFRKSTGIPVRC